MNNRLVRFSAWCSGTAYRYPNKVFCDDKHRSIDLFVDNLYLAKFKFWRIAEYKKAVKIANQAVVKSMKDSEAL